MFAFNIFILYSISYSKYGYKLGGLFKFNVNCSSSEEMTLFLERSQYFNEKLIKRVIGIFDKYFGKRQVLPFVSLLGKSLFLILKIAQPIVYIFNAVT